jgi:hypothetical protein
VSCRRASPRLRPRSEAGANRDANTAVREWSGPAVWLTGRAAANEVTARRMRGNGALGRATAAICCPHSSGRRSGFRFDDTELHASVTSPDVTKYKSLARGGLGGPGGYPPGLLARGGQSPDLPRLQNRA